MAEMIQEVTVSQEVIERDFSISTTSSKQASIKRKVSTDLGTIGKQLVAPKEAKGSDIKQMADDSVESLLQSTSSTQFVGSLYDAILALSNLTGVQANELIPAQAALSLAVSKVQLAISNAMNARLKEDTAAIKAAGSNQEKLAQAQAQYNEDQKIYDNYLNTWGTMSQSTNSTVSSTEQDLSQLLSVVGQILSTYGSTSQLIMQI